MADPEEDVINITLDEDPATSQVMSILAKKNSEKGQRSWIKVLGRLLQTCEQDSNSDNDTLDFSSDAGEVSDNYMNEPCTSATGVSQNLRSIGREKL